MQSAALHQCVNPLHGGPQVRRCLGGSQVGTRNRNCLPARSDGLVRPVLTHGHSSGKEAVPGQTPSLTLSTYFTPAPFGTAGVAGFGCLPAFIVTSCRNAFQLRKVG